MKIDFDPQKSRKNIAERHLSFEEAAEFDWETAIYSEDIRYHYPERRFRMNGSTCFALPPLKMVYELSVFAKPTYER